jgi:hypothetical protein
MSLAERFSRSIDGELVAERIAQASRNLRDALRDSGTRITRGASAGADYARSGVDYARALGDDALASTQRVGRSTRAAIAERPVETLLVVGLAAFAIGWLSRRVQEARSERAARGEARVSRPRASSARTNGKRRRAPGEDAD